MESSLEIALGQALVKSYSFTFKLQMHLAQYYFLLSLLGVLEDKQIYNFSMLSRISA